MMEPTASAYISEGPHIMLANPDQQVRIANTNHLQVANCTSSISKVVLYNANVKGPCTPTG